MMGKRQPAENDGKELFQFVMLTYPREPKTSAGGPAIMTRHIIDLYAHDEHAARRKIFDDVRAAGLWVYELELNIAEA